MKFEIGKYYRHSTDSYLYICGEVDTHMWGKCLVGEMSSSGGFEHRLQPTGRSECNAMNWEEITEAEFKKKAFDSDDDVESENSEDLKCDGEATLS